MTGLLRDDARQRGIGESSSLCRNSGCLDEVGSLVLADLLVSLGGQQSLEVGRVRELDLAQPAYENRAAEGKEARSGVRRTCWIGPRRCVWDGGEALTVALGLLVEQAGLIVELLVDGLNGTRNRSVDVGSGLDLYRWSAQGGGTEGSVSGGAPRYD